jgi:GAF domain-containing protein
VTLLKETGDSLEVLTLKGQAGAVPVGASLPLEGTAVGMAVRENRMVSTSDARASDFVDVKQMAEQGVLSTMSVPLVVGGQAVGTLNVGSTRVQGFDLRDENMMRQVGALLSSAIENRRLIEETERASFLLGERVKELNCLNDLGREMEGSPSIPELLHWTTERIPPAMQHPELCVVAIEYDNQIYGEPQAIHLPGQMTHGLYLGSEIVGRVYIAYTDKRDFLDEESALLGGVANRLSGYIENRRLFEQVQFRARREQMLREVTDRIRGSVDVETIMRTAAQEVGQVLGRPAFVYLGNGEKSSSTNGEPNGADS